MGRARTVKFSVAAVALIGLSVWMWRTPRFAMLRDWTQSTSQFLPEPTDSRVLYEPGAEAIARSVALAMPGAVRTVEAKLGRPFCKPIRVYVCATWESFDRYAHRNVMGMTYARRVFFSPKATRKSLSIPEWLVAHELTHLHVQHQRGIFPVFFGDGDPDWFNEGLAVYASGGIDHEMVSELQAWRAIADGRHFLSNRSLNYSQLYRQSGMFIGYLHEIDPEKFRRFVFAAEDNGDPEAALKAAYGKSLQDLVSEFTAEAARRVAR